MAERRPLIKLNGRTQELPIGDTLPGGGGGGSTNLAVANRTATTLDVTSDTGTNATVPQASITEAGLLTATDKTKLDDIEANAKDDQVASEVPVTPNGNLTSTDVQAGLEEHQGDIDTINQTLNEREFDVSNQTSPYVAVFTNDVIFTTSDITLYAGLNQIKPLNIRNLSTSKITITPDGLEQIEGSTNVKVGKGDSITLVFNVSDSNWYII